MAIVQIPGTNLYRDTNSMALINKDKTGQEDYKMKRRLLETQAQEINKVKSEINDIKQDLSEIKSLMLRLLDKGSNG
jgi:hypothetical protein